MNKNIVALDIGDGQVKVVSGDSYTRPVTTAIFPAGAAPVELVDTAGFQRGGEFSDGKEVVVNGAVFRALIDPRSIMHGMNNLHREYATTDEYKALFKGALASLESTRFDSLVTGLPISHYKL